MQNITPETTATHQRSDKGELWKLSFYIMTDSENKQYLGEGQTGFVIYRGKSHWLITKGS